MTAESTDVMLVELMVDCLAGPMAEMKVALQVALTVGSWVAVTVLHSAALTAIQTDSYSAASMAVPTVGIKAD